MQAEAMLYNASQGYVVRVESLCILRFFLKKYFLNFLRFLKKTENVGFASFGIWWGPTLGFWATIGGFLKVWKLIDQDTPSLGPGTRS